MKKNSTLAIILIALFLCSNSAFSQRTLTNPIILVHGWTGGSIETWKDFTKYLEDNASLSIERNSLNYNLNCDNNVNTSYLYNDVCDNNSGSLGNKDIYIINFNSGSNMSNQSAVVKQGYALKFAISKVLSATGADNVILLGHSMGGLAIREYLQNPSNWQSDGQHHIAKMATIGTPHYGSDFGTSDFNLGIIFKNKDEASESVRDFRTSYKSGYNGVYLFGGYENSTTIKRGLFSSYYNLDVNCNGREGDYVTGLNQKDIYTNLDFSCIIGGPNNSDFLVTAFSQNLNNIYPINAELYYFNCNLNPFCHTNEPKEASIQMIQALDEPKKYPTNIKFGNPYRGFFSTQANGSYSDKDDYNIYAPQRGIISFSASSVVASSAKISVYDQAGTLLASEWIGNSLSKSFQITSAGYYKISIEGSSLGTWATYGFSFGFCGVPAIPTISASSSTSFCEGNPITISTIAGYDEYKWFKDGVQITTNSNQLSVNQTGTFTVQASKCGITSNSTNNITTNVKSSPIKPTINKDEQIDNFLLTSSSLTNNQWFLNGNLINNANTQTYIPQELGVFTVRVTNDGCTNISESSTVKMDKPTIMLVGSNPFCDGDSSKLVAPTGFGNYIFSDGKKEIPKNKNELIVTQTGEYYVATKRGKFISNLSDPISIKVNPKPLKPILTLENFGLKSSSLTNNQWFLNGNAIKDSTGQFLHSFSSGSYTVRVIENGCFSESNAFIVTSIDPNTNSFPIKLYPNPNDGAFWVELPQTFKTWQVEIYDVQGKQILSKFHSDSFINREQIEIKTVTGTYILRISTEKATQSIKFIIE